MQIVHDEVSKITEDHYISVDGALVHPLIKKKIAIIAPSSALSQSYIGSLSKLLNVEEDFLKKFTNLEIPYHANSDQVRLESLKEAIYSDDCDIIWALKGGYGAARLIKNLIKLNKPLKNKVFIGYSDITALHLFFSQNWHWHTIHGMLIVDLLTETHDKNNLELIVDILNKCTQKSIIIDDLKPINEKASDTSLIKGKITGGNLTLLENSIGSQWQLDAREKIVFIEDVDVKGYQIDRSLYHLAESGILSASKAIVLGDFNKGNENHEVTFALKRFAKYCNLPVFKSNFFGHGIHNYPIIYNAIAVIKKQRNRDDFSVNIAIPHDFSY